MPTVIGTTRYGDINQRTAAWAATEMLAHAEPSLVLSKMGMTKPMPKNKAETVKFRRPIPFAAATEPVVEGVTPSPQKVLYEDVTVTLRQYGRPIEITDRAAVNTPITLTKQRAVTRGLNAQKARKITRMLASGTGYDVHPIEAAFIAVAHTDLEHDIRNLAGFVPTAKYGTRQTVSEYEIGSVDSVRYVLSPDLAAFASAGGLKAGSGTTMVSTDGTNADVYPILFFGQDAFASIPLKGSEAITPMVVNAKPSDSDPMAQRNYVSWKTYFASSILNEMWMARLEVAATAL